MKGACVSAFPASLADAPLIFLKKLETPCRLNTCSFIMVLTVNPHEADTLKTRPTLISKVRRGDEDGWSRFYELYADFIHSAARAAGLAEDQAKDIVQETMVTVQNYITNFVPDDNRARFRTWLRKIVQSRIADHYRRRRRNALDHANDPPAADETATSQTNRIPNLSEIKLDRLVDEKLEQALLEEARNRAKEKVRMEDYQAYDLFALQELPAKEVAASLGISPATVRVRTFRVRRIVQRELRRIGRMLEQPHGPRLPSKK
jgi:RNA polymerase sigma-70 factor (ECF subfamily)